MEKSAISVKIFNETYMLRTEAPEKQVIAVAQLVDAKMKTLAGNKKVPQEKIAVWAALDLAADLLALEERYQKLVEASRER